MQGGKVVPTPQAYYILECHMLQLALAREKGGTRFCGQRWDLGAANVPLIRNLP